MKGVFVHPLALVESADIGPGCRIWPFTHVMAGARVGARCNVGSHTFIESGALVGDDVTIKNGCMIWEGVARELAPYSPQAIVVSGLTRAEAEEGVAELKIETIFRGIDIRAEWGDIYVAEDM